MARRLGCSIYLPVSVSVTHFSKETEATDHRPVTPTKKRGGSGAADSVRCMIENVEDKVKILAETNPGARAAVYPLLHPPEIRPEPTENAAGNHGQSCKCQTADLLKLRLAGSDMEPKTIPTF